MAGEKAHALLGASSAHRWLTCTPSAILEKDFPDSTSQAAAEGTLAHELAELKVRNYFHTVEFGKQKYTRRVNKLKKEELWQDEMEGYTDIYLDYIKTVALGLPTKPYIAVEQRVTFEDWVSEGFGTADCIMVYGDTVHVFDFKYGKGVLVEAEDNPQMMLYALGAYAAYRMLYPIKQIKMTIIQPRIDHVSDWQLSVEKLLEFGEYTKERAALAEKGEGEYCPSESACRFCRAKARCRARAEENARLAFLTHMKPPLLTNEEVGTYLQQGADVARWLKDLQDYALGECLAGKDVPGWKAVEGRGSREWTDMDEAFAKLQEKGINEEILWERKPLTLPQIEKTIGKKEFTEYVGDLVMKKPGKPALAKESDKREAITNKLTAAEAFQEGE